LKRHEIHDATAADLFSLSLYYFTFSTTTVDIPSFFSLSFVWVWARYLFDEPSSVQQGDH